MEPERVSLNSYKLYNVEGRKKLLGGLWSLCIDIFVRDRDFPVQLSKLDSCADFLVASLSSSERET